MKINSIKRISVAILMVVTIVSCAKKRDGFVINGTLSGGLKLDSVSITPESMTDIKPIYKVPVVDGKFTITGKVKEIEKVNISNNKANIGSTFILENEEYSVDIGPEFFTIKGGEVNEELFGFYNTKEYSEIMNKFQSASRKLMAIDMDSDSEEAREEAYQLNRKIDIYMDQAYKIEDANFRRIMEDENSSTLAKMFVLTTSQSYKDFPTQKRRELLAEYKKELGEHRNLINFVKFLDQQDLKEKMSKSVVNGAQFKPITGVDVNGKEVSLGDVVKKNKYTLLEFWAAWCSPCRAEVPHLKEAYAKYKDQGLEIYSYSIDDGKDDWKQAIKEDQPNWDIHLIKRGKEGEKVLTAYGVSGIPASYLIDQNGVIVATNEELRGDALKGTLKAVFKK